MSEYEKFYKRISLFEIATIMQFPQSRKMDGAENISGVYFGDAYAEGLESQYPFRQIDWSSLPFLGFAIIKTAPPKRLIVKNENVEFEAQSSLAVENWREFFKSYQQVRNNVMHGAKLFMGMKLADRDHELMSACLRFIDFMENKEFIQELH